MTPRSPQSRNIPQDVAPNSPRVARRRLLHGYMRAMSTHIELICLIQSKWNGGFVLIYIKLRFCSSVQERKKYYSFVSTFFILVWHVSQERENDVSPMLYLLNFVKDCIVLWISHRVQIFSCTLQLVFLVVFLLLKILENLFGVLNVKLFRKLLSVYFCIN